MSALVARPRERVIMQRAPYCRASWSRALKEARQYGTRVKNGSRKRLSHKTVELSR